MFHIEPHGQVEAPLWFEHPPPHLQRATCHEGLCGQLHRGGRAVPVPLLPSPGHGHADLQRGDQPALVSEAHRRPRERHAAGPRLQQSPLRAAHLGRGDRRLSGHRAAVPRRAARLGPRRLPLPVLAAGQHGRRLDSGQGHGEGQRRPDGQPQDLPAFPRLVRGRRVRARRRHQLRLCHPLRGAQACVPRGGRAGRHLRVPDSQRLL
mmetsp:Transcript_38531/g.120322  ORF Transcript_38531/g.120322 Transcript_38531/m.120322 type:complete len:207 (+) Transcript_38531:254-874(+)